MEEGVRYGLRGDKVDEPGSGSSLGMIRTCLQEEVLSKHSPREDQINNQVQNVRKQGNGNAVHHIVICTGLGQLDVDYICDNK